MAEFLSANVRCYHRQCVHYQGIRPADPAKPQVKQVPTCTAFPDGIPESIAFGKDDHLESVDGDGGTVYQRFAGSPAEYRTRLALQEQAAWYQDMLSLLK